MIKGSVEVLIEDEEGNEMVLAYLNKGQFFGEMGLFNDQPARSAWVRTRSQCELAEMTYPRFRQIGTAITGDVVFSPGLTYAPTYAGSADGLQVQGNVDLGGATLDIGA